MVKDKSWLKQEISEIFWRAEIDDNLNIQDANLIFDKVENAINQLDEPEILSQEWIDENKVARIDNLRKMTTSDVVPVEKLKNLLVPKQGKSEKPVIPQFVADWYESEGKRSSWWNWFYKWGRGEHRTDLETKTIRWMQDFNEELFVDMFRFGYEVEEEQKYYVLDSEDIPLLERANNQTCKTTMALSI